MFKNLKIFEKTMVLTIKILILNILKKKWII